MTTGVTIRREASPTANNASPTRRSGAPIETHSQRSRTPSRSPSPAREGSQPQTDLDCTRLADRFSLPPTRVVAVAHRRRRTRWRLPTPDDCLAMCDARSRITSELLDWRSTGCELSWWFQVRARWPVPASACVVRLLVGGVRSPGKSPRAARSIRAATGEGKTGRANTCEPLVDALLSSTLACGTVGGGKGLVAAKRQGRPGSGLDRDEHHCPRGTEGAYPGRSSCVRNAVTPSRSGRAPGRVR